MNQTARIHPPIFCRLAAGLLAGWLGAAMVAGAARAAPAQQDPPTPTPEPQDCAACHPNVGDTWLISPHAYAYEDAIFQERWQSLGEPGDCLVCHTTGYQATTGAYTAEGVTCEACHGAAQEGHPPAVMPIRSDTEYCGTCHPITLGEWRLTGHAAADVGCSDCHNPHSQEARFENTDELCINCHKDNLGEHQNDTHIQKGVRCVECHALVIPPDVPPNDGLAPTGHSFTITPATCVACHTDTLHIGKPVPGYEAGAKAVSASLPMTSTLPTLVAEYTGGAKSRVIQPEQQIQALEAALASTRLSTLFQGGLIGLALGGSTFYLIARNQRQNGRPGSKADAEEDTDHLPGNPEQDRE